MGRHRFIKPVKHTGSVHAQLPVIDLTVQSQIHRFTIETSIIFFPPSEVEIIMEAFEEVKRQIKKKENTATVTKQRDVWQSITDRLNAEVVHEYTLTAQLKPLQSKKLMTKYYR